MMQNPCKHCAKRTATCHATCGRYLVWARWNRQRRVEENKANLLDYQLRNSVATRRSKRKRKINGK